MDTPDTVQILTEVENALKAGRPVVALESTVITHGLPFPQNFELACEMEEIIEQRGATPATIALLDGKVHVGIHHFELKRLAEGLEMRKISARDIRPAIALGGPAERLWRARFQWLDGSVCGCSQPGGSAGYIANRLLISPQICLCWLAHQ